MFSNFTAVLLIVGVAGAEQTAPPAPPAPRMARSVTIRRISPGGWLGIGIGEVTPERAKVLKLSTADGIEVFQVEGNSPALRAGLKPGDVITEIDGRKVTDVDAFMHVIGEASPGTKVSLEVWRNGAKQSLTATLESRPMQYFTAAPMAPLPPMPPEPFGVMTVESPRIGFEGETLTPQLAQFFGVKEGVLVRTIFPKTAAEKAGLKAGDIIFKVSGTPVSSPREISGLVHASNKSTTFTVMRNHKEIVLNVEIAGDRMPSADGEVL